MRLSFVRTVVVSTLIACGSLSAVGCAQVSGPTTAEVIGTIEKAASRSTTRFMISKVNVLESSGSVRDGNGADPCWNYTVNYFREDRNHVVSGGNITNQITVCKSIVDNNGTIAWYYKGGATSF